MDPTLGPRFRVADEWIVSWRRPTTKELGRPPRLLESGYRNQDRSVDCKAENTVPSRAVMFSWLGSVHARG